MDRVWTTQKKTECGLYKKKKKPREREKRMTPKFFGMNSVKDGFALSSGMLELAHTDPGIW